MSAVNLQDIREWGKSNGFDVADSGPLPKGLRSAYMRRDDKEVITSIERDESNADAFPSVADYLAGEEAEKVTERAPTPYKPTVVDRVRAISARAKKVAPKKTASSVSRIRARVAVDRIIERAWEMVGRVVRPVNLPVARVMTVQAPIAGLLLEDIIKGTIVDKALQPIARAEEKGELAFALLGPPLLVGALTTEKGQAAAPVLVPMLKESLRVWLQVAGPKIEIAAQREAEFAEKYGQKIDEMIAMFFAMPEGSDVSTD